FYSFLFFALTADGPLGPGCWKVGLFGKIKAALCGPEKPLINTETALLCIIATPECREAQTDAIGRYYARAINDELAGQMWYIYDNDSFFNTALVEPSNVAVPRPAFHAYQAAATLLENTRALGPLAGQPAGVEGYRFSR